MMRATIQAGTDTLGTLGDLPTKNLKIDPTYQRHLSKGRVDKMASNWNDNLAGALEVSSRNGSYFVMDGMHRLVAARTAGVTHLTCIIHEGLSAAEEAERFALLNTSRTRPSAFDIFRARKQAQEPLVLDILRTCQHFGVPIIRGGDHGYGTYAVTTIEGIALQSLGLLDQTLRVATRAWPENQNGVKADPLNGIANFIAVYGDHPTYREARLIEKLAAFPPSYLIQRAKEVGATRGKHGTGFSRSGPRLAVLELWNRHLRNPLPVATPSDLKQISMGRNPWVTP